MIRLGAAIVIDASVAVKWLIPEPDSALASQLAEGRRLLAPELIAVECANILWKHVRIGEIPHGDAVTGIQDLRSSPLILTPDAGLLPAAQELARQHDHPIYDCLYLALAHQEGVAVVTADRRFARLSAHYPTLTGKVIDIRDLR